MKEIDNIKTKDYTYDCLNYLSKLIEIDSPIGYTQQIADYVDTVLKQFNIKTYRAKKGGVVCEIPGKTSNSPVLLLAHLDTLGAMVSEIKDDGRLAITPLGGLNANNIETENVRIITKFNGEFEGTVNVINASIHVNKDYNNIRRDFNSIEVIVDEDTKTKLETLKLGISVGDIVCIAPRFRITKKGYIKSRFLDNKLSVAVLLSFIKHIYENNVTLNRGVSIHFTVYEEMGFGPSVNISSTFDEILAIDNGCIGKGLNCTEKQVSICAKDSHGPYSYDLVRNLIETARLNNIDYEVDVYPDYSSDVASAMCFGVDSKHALIGPGVYASHGYERSHLLAIENLFKLLYYYLT